MDEINRGDLKGAENDGIWGGLVVLNWVFLSSTRHKKDKSVVICLYYGKLHAHIAFNCLFY
jgi:hypothetical protein